MRKCKLCERDIYIAPNGKESVFCATHLLEALESLIEDEDIKFHGLDSFIVFSIISNN